MKLVAISDPNFIPNEAEIINGLFADGLKYLHLRKPDSTEKELSALIEKINPRFHDRLSLHQHHVLAKETGISRLHFPEKNRWVMNEQALRKLKDEGYTISTSVHSIEQLNALSPSFDYTFFGPVFNSISKKGYKGILNENFYLNTTLKNMEVVALGGIDHSNLNKIREMNFDAAAVLGALWKDPEMAREAFNKLSRSCKY